MSDSSVVDDIIEEIGNCQDPSQLKELTGKLKDAMALQGGDLMRKLVEKWANKLKPFKNDNDIRNLAFILENQYKYTKGNEDFDFTKEARKKIDLLREQAEELGGEAGEILLKQAEEKEKNLPPKLEEMFEMRGVNIQDEIVKLYDCISMKPMIAIQPMTGPVGLAYALRFRQNMEPVIINGKEMEVGLTVEQKEVKARTRKLKVRGKVSGPEVAKEIDFELANRVVNMAHPVGFVSKEMLIEQLKASIKDVACLTKLGPANCILSNGKYITDEIKELFEHNIVFPNLKDHDIVVGYGGTKGNDAGLIYCPYVPLMFAKAIGSESVSPSSGVMTRYGICDDLYGSTHFYHKHHVLDATEEVVENFRRFYKNTMLFVDNDEMKKRVTCIAMRVYQELSENFTKVIPVAEELSDDMEDITLKARWSIEAQQELKEIHNLDFEEELMDLMGYEIVNELKELDFIQLYSFGFGRDEYGTLTPRPGTYVKALLKEEAEPVKLIKKYAKYLEGITTDEHVKQCAYFLKNTEERNEECDDSMLKMASNIYKNIIDSAAPFVGIQVPKETGDTATSYRMRLVKGEDERETGIKLEDEEFKLETLTKSICYENPKAKADLETMHSGIDIGEEIKDLACFEFSSSVSTYLINKCKEDKDPDFIWKYPSKTPEGSNGEFEQAVFRALYTAVLNACEEIARETRRGAGNAVMVSPKSAVCLQTIKEFEQVDRKDISQYGSISHVGDINGLKIYRNLSKLEDEIIVSYKGTNETDAGIIVILESLEFIDGEKIKLNYAVDNDHADGYYKKIKVELGI
jgi:hypothetical protein